MSLVFLPNNLDQDAVLLTVTDGSNVETGETAGLTNVAGGDRRLAWSSSDSGAKRLVYVNKAGGLGCTHIVVARADLHAGKNLSIRSWTSYPATSAADFSASSFSETLLGPREQDWVLPLELSGKQAIGLCLNSTDYGKDVYKFYGSQGLTFDHHTAPTFEELRFPDRHVFRRQMYLADTEWRFFIEQLTRAELDEFEAIPNLLSEPLFVYNPDGCSIPSKLVHGVVDDYQHTAVFDDIYQLSITVKELRQWV